MWGHFTPTLEDVRNPAASRSEPNCAFSMSLQVLYAGCGGGIAVFHKQPAGPPKLHTIHEVDGGAGAFCVAPNAAHLFAAVSGSISTFAICPHSGELTAVGKPSPPFTDGPAYLTTDRAGRFILHASYGGGSCAVHPIGPGGQVGAELQHQVCSNSAHSIMTDPTNRFVFTPCIAEANGTGSNSRGRSLAVPFCEDRGGT